MDNIGWFNEFADYTFATAQFKIDTVMGPNPVLESVCCVNSGFTLLNYMLTILTGPGR